MRSQQAHREEATKIDLDVPEELNSHLSAPKNSQEPTNLRIDTMLQSELETVSSSIPLTATNSSHNLLERESLYRRFKATVKLLAESLEEQGNLRALMELTSNPDLCDSLLQSDLFRLSSYDLGTSNDIPKVLLDAKFRALLIEQEQLISQV